MLIKWKIIVDPKDSHSPLLSLIDSYFPFLPLSISSCPILSPIVLCKVSSPLLPLQGTSWRRKENLSSFFSLFVVTGSLLLSFALFNFLPLSPSQYSSTFFWPSILPRKEITHILRNMYLRLFHWGGLVTRICKWASTFCLSSERRSPLHRWFHGDSRS